MKYCQTLINDDEYESSNIASFSERITGNINLNHTRYTPASATK